MRRFLRAAAAGIATGALSLAIAQAPERKPPGFPDGPGKDVLLGKCFQCHGPSMWSNHRQDRRAWESTLYRMVGRGALWSEDEIREMADYLGTVYGKESK